MYKEIGVLRARKKMQFSSLKSLSAQLLGALAVLALASACESPDTIGSGSEPLGVSGRWIAPDHILAEGDTQNVEYTGAGPWKSDKSSCQGGFTSGGEAFRSYLMAYFPQIERVGGYACRPIVGNSSQTSVHATGRALDLMIRRTAQGYADNDLGDPIASWLIQNAEFIGIQFIIWDRSSWGPHRRVGAKQRPYNGGSPHTDHLHIELSTHAGAMQTPWFASTQPPPDIDSCETLAPEGGVIDERNPCTQFLGPGASWRRVVGQGFADTLVWTNAAKSDTRANWARWQIVPSVAGQYKIEIFGGSEFSVHKNARYELVHNGESSEFVVDQSALQGWHSLGEFSFAAGGGQGLEVFDNNQQAVASDQHIAVDAIRITAVAGPSDPPNDPSPTPNPTPNEVDRSGITGGCATGSRSSSLPVSILVLLALACIRRRKWLS